MRELTDLHQVWRMRAFEEKVRELRLAEEVVGSVHLGIGQEAIAVGAAGLIGSDDAVFATYRGHSWALACGVPPENLFGEVLGRTCGINGGRGGSAYLTAPRYRFFGENSIVGAGAPIAVGAALAGRYDHSNRVVLTVFGDGAMNQGAVHEAMNFAAAMLLPVVFLCENNSWSELTPISDMVGDDRLYRRAAAYGLPGERIDGNDPDVVRTHLASAFERARTGGGPTLLEAMTARLVGHYIGDAEQYRRPGELEEARRHEPVTKLTEQARRNGAADADIEQAELVAREEMESAAAEALRSEHADPATAKDHLYA
ncbi:thiamine pyrophosphate-dependent dehydrogenase E1 component subunit alpha [Saccharopolyspora sp. K220]|uniref:thiamine pyrophosphate-dependent dehydrogenase E1 component subunit alpha n=1 Tax=Saccharopolyspora soli TaxID=2926618 RepID=UPI001F567F96|nr:thiamine pyrophosphate-dependent dehydrogenase E1 component subunit alpha [Saccharopolyspora soli]MCI2419541.1 thiamine pyrophosphate-dependent dehydrogenase E1 component subunit alpha [Saccharopolyspora soli]